MIRIKAPRVWLSAAELRSIPARCALDGDSSRRLYSEAMHRRVLALVRAVDEFATDESRRPGLFIGKILDAHAAIRAQAEKEAGK